MTEERVKIIDSKRATVRSVWRGRIRLATVRESVRRVRPRGLIRSWGTCDNGTRQ